MTIRFVVQEEKRHDNNDDKEDDDIISLLNTTFFHHLSEKEYLRGVAATHFHVHKNEIKRISVIAKTFNSFFKCFGHLKFHCNIFLLP